MAGMKNDDAGLIDDSTGMLEKDTGMIIDNDDTDDIVNGRRKRSRERGKDTKPRNFPLHTLKNLPQFRNKPHEEVRQYILETKGVDIGDNFNWNGFAMAILIVFAVVIGGYGIWKWYEHKKHDANYG